MHPVRFVAVPSALLALLLLSSPAAAANDDTGQDVGAYAPPPAPDLVETHEQSQPQREVTRVGRISLLAGESAWFAESMSSRGWVRTELNLPIVSSSSLSTAPASARAGQQPIGW